MGSYLSSMYKGETRMKLLMLGLDASGKSTIFNRLTLNECETTVPTVGYNKGTFWYKNINLMITETGGQKKYDPYVKQYFNGTQGVIYVIDSTDRERIDEAKFQLHSLVAERKLKNCFFLIFANKQDLPDAMKVGEIEKRLQMRNHKSRMWFVQPTSAITGDGLKKGLKVLTSFLKIFESIEDDKYSEQDKVDIVQEKLTKKQERAKILQDDRALKQDLIKALLEKYI